MKLICEFSETINYVTEANEKGGGKSCYIEGVFMQGNVKNKNGRVYETSILERECKRYTESHIIPKRALGELGHPAGPTINLERVSHMITRLERTGDDFAGRAKILDTPYGNIVKNLIVAGAGVGVSTRGMGSVKDVDGTIHVQPDFHLATVDIVADPSAPSAFVEGIMEGKDWVWDNGIIKEVQVAQYKNRVETAARANRTGAEVIQVFNDFFKGL